MQRYFSNKVENELLILDENDLHHIYKVMRMKNGDKLEIVYENKLYLCSLIDEKAHIDKLIETKKIKTEITLIIPILKEQKMDLIIQKATELGVDNIIPFNAERSIVKIINKEEKKIIRWQKIAKEASEQSKRLDIPKIHNVKNLNELNNIHGIKIVCSTKKGITTLKNLLHKNKVYDKITIVIGPEGGLSAFEEKQLNDFDFISVSLGSLIMRVETVPIYILSVLSFMNME